ncbi:hypothetical protein RHSIM_Rhsim05G0215300 [Rhododendron simsii]|uniref:TORTIFOLIA1/SINE1-2 N-terminal domain-containing protein n=1 Tax=Rhododendron simsii TaxID=118357 RepID=A0A834GXD8_RHOSS|nr:hypothetical protein RHSIM_Rhsim05G0215300 [Rhododendron simsii]
MSLEWFTSRCSFTAVLFGLWRERNFQGLSTDHDQVAHRFRFEAGGAPSQIILSAAMISIQEALKNSDWTTRKAASLSLGEIASSCGSFFSSFKASCIRSLESCRFDKVKPVRDTVPHALHLWRSLPGPDPPEPSETGSSIKENFCGQEDGDIASINESGRKDASLTKVGTCSTKKRIPLSVRKTCQNYVDYPQGSMDWDTEIAAPKTNSVYFDVHNEESEGSSVTKTFERMSSDITSIQDIGYEYVSMDDRHECSSVSKPVTKNVDTKFVSASRDCINKVALVNQMVPNQEYAAEEIRSEEHRYSVKMQDHSSLDSTGTESSSQTLRECCTQTANELASIRKQLLEVDNKRSNLMDLLQVTTLAPLDIYRLQASLLSITLPTCIL